MRRKIKTVMEQMNAEKPDDVLADLERKHGCAAPAGSARAWQCNLGNGQWDHDWQEKHDDSGGVDGGPSDQWSWRECRVCGEIEAPNVKDQP